MTSQELSLRQITSLLRRAPSALSREIRRHATATVPYDAAVAGRQTRQRLRQPRSPRKKPPHTANASQLRLAAVNPVKGSMFIMFPFLLYEPATTRIK